MRLFYDFWILKDIAKELPQNGFESHEALVTATKIMNTFQRGDQQSLEACRILANKILGKDRDSHEVYKPDNGAYVTAIGNCHIDTYGQLFLAMLIVGRGCGRLQRLVARLVALGALR